MMQHLIYSFATCYYFQHVTHVSHYNTSRSNIKLSQLSCKHTNLNEEQQRHKLALNDQSLLFYLSFSSLIFSLMNSPFLCFFYTPNCTQAFGYRNGPKSSPLKHWGEDFSHEYY